MYRLAYKMKDGSTKYPYIDLEPWGDYWSSLTDECKDTPMLMESSEAEALHEQFMNCHCDAPDSLDDLEIDSVFLERIEINVLDRLKVHYV